MAAYIKTLQDATKTNIIYPVTKASAVYTDDNTSVQEVVAGSVVASEDVYSTTPVVTYMAKSSPTGSGALTMNQSANLSDESALILKDSSANTVSKFDYEGDLWVEGNVYVGGTDKSNGAILGRKPFMTKVTLTTVGWDDETKTQTVTVNGILADETAQLIQIAPGSAGMNYAIESGVYCSGRAENSLTFSCSVIPIENIDICISWQDAIFIS